MPRSADCPTGKRRARGTTRPLKVIAVDHQACILCDRCIRACDDVQHNDVIGRTGKGYTARISFDLDSGNGRIELRELRRVRGRLSRPVRSRTCRSPCAAAGRAANPGIRSIPSAPTAAWAARLTYHVDRESEPGGLRRGAREPRQPGADSASRVATASTTSSHPAPSHEVPLVRVDYPKRGAVAGGRVSSKRRRRAQARRSGRLRGQVMPAFREATWDEALDLVATQTARGPRGALGVPALWRASDRRSAATRRPIVFQKLVRVVFGTNNVDHCTRLCHASSVAALLQMIGSGAVTTTYGDIEQFADVALITGTNTTANHPVAATFFKQAAEHGGTRLIVVDPRRSRNLRPGLALLSDPLGHRCRLLQRLDAPDHRSRTSPTRTTSPRHTTGASRTLKRTVASPTLPDRVSGICGIPVETAAAKWRWPTAKPERGAHLLGHGHEPARARNRQLSLHHLAGADDRERGAPRHGTAPAAGAEQRAGRLGRRA